MKHLLIDNEKIAYRQIGNKKSEFTFVFIHGATMTGKGLLPLAKSFIDYNCVVIDLPGHGASVGETKYSVEEFTKSIDVFLMELLHKKIISNHITLIGYSMGGSISFELALKKREEYKRMIILSSGANVTQYTPLIDEMKKQSKEKFNSAEFMKHGFGLNTTDEQKKFLLAILNKTKVNDSIGFSDLVAAGAYNKIEKASEIQIPTLIFAGDEDEIILPQCGMDLWKELKNASIVIVPFYGHTVIFEKIDYLISVMNDFFKLTN